MQNNTKELSWRHIEKVYEASRALSAASHGLNLIPKVGYEHIHLTSYSKMRVDLAAEVSINKYMHACPSFIYLHMHDVVHHVCILALWFHTHRS